MPGQLTAAGSAQLAAGGGILRPVAHRRLDSLRAARAAAASSGERACEDARHGGGSSSSLKSPDVSASCTYEPLGCTGRSTRWPKESIAQGRGARGPVPACPGPSARLQRNSVGTSGRLVSRQEQNPYLRTPLAPLQPSIHLPIPPDSCLFPPHLLSVPRRSLRCHAGCLLPRRLSAAPRLQVRANPRVHGSLACGETPPAGRDAHTCPGRMLGHVSGMSARAAATRWRVLNAGLGCTSPARQCSRVKFPRRHRRSSNTRSCSSSSTRSRHSGTCGRTTCGEPGSQIAPYQGALHGCDKEEQAARFWREG